MIALSNKTRIFFNVISFSLPYILFLTKWNSYNVNTTWYSYCAWIIKNHCINYDNRNENLVINLILKKKTWVKASGRSNNILFIPRTLILKSTQLDRSIYSRSTGTATTRSNTVEIGHNFLFIKEIEAPKLPSHRHL